MSYWDRINSLELELVLAQSEIRILREQRDTARRIAVRLEQENAALDVVYVPVVGEAR